ncbi:PCBP3 [Symbiodinium sp. CCMP2592]|nr:PCBP3 [Symbiodinium sp. CCMP2592]
MAFAPESPASGLKEDTGVLSSHGWRKQAVKEDGSASNSSTPTTGCEPSVSEASAMASARDSLSRMCEYSFDKRCAVSLTQMQRPDEPEGASRCRSKVGGDLQRASVSLMRASAAASSSSCSATSQEIGVQQGATKLLLPSEIVSEQSDSLRHIQQSSGARLQVLNQVQAAHFAERLVHITGSLEGRQFALTQVLKLAFANQQVAKAKFLVPGSHVGTLIGKGGDGLKAIRQQCGTPVQVEREEICGDRLVSVCGELSSVLDACGLILEATEAAKKMKCGAGSHKTHARKDGRRKRCHHPGGGDGPPSPACRR